MHDLEGEYREIVLNNKSSNNNLCLFLYPSGIVIGIAIVITLII